MIPPSYSDLGKGARDLFSKGFHLGQVKLEGKSKTANGINFTATGTSNVETGKIVGNLESKYKWAEYGVTVNEKWNTDNVLATELTIEDQIAKGLKLSFDTSFAPQTGKKSGKIKSAFKREHINVNFDVDFDFAGPTLHGAAVALYNGWVLGYQATFDSAKSQMTKNNVAVGHLGSDFALHAAILDSTEFVGSVHHKLRPGLEAGVTFSWTSGSSATKFGFATKYDMDRDTILRAKITNDALVGLSYSQNLNNGINMTLSSLIDGKNLNVGGHKLGLGLEFSA